MTQRLIPGRFLALCLSINEAAESTAMAPLQSSRNSKAVKRKMAPDSHDGHEPSAKRLDQGRRASTGSGPTNARPAGTTRDTPVVVLSDESETSTRAVDVAKSPAKKQRTQKELQAIQDELKRKAVAKGYRVPAPPIYPVRRPKKTNVKPKPRAVLDAERREAMKIFPTRQTHEQKQWYCPVCKKIAGRRTAKVIAKLMIRLLLRANLG